MLFGICRPIAKVYRGHLDFPVAGSINDFCVERGGEMKSSRSSGGSRNLDGVFMMVLHFDNRGTLPLPAVPRSSSWRPVSSARLLTVDPLRGRNSGAVMVGMAFRAEPTPARDLPPRLGSLLLFFEPGGSPKMVA